MMSLFLGFSVSRFIVDFITPVAGLAPLLKWAAFAFAVPVLIYAGMLLRSMRAIRLWGGPFLPGAFGAQALASGFTLVWAYAGWFDPTLHSWLQPVTLAALLLCATFSALHVATIRKTAGVRASLERMRSGDLKGPFVMGGWFVGIVIPLLILILAQARLEDSAALAAIAAVSRICGDFTYRNAIVRAGAYEPVVPTAPYELFRKVAAST